MTHPCNERLLIGGGTLAALLSAWEIVADTGLIDPLFISSPSPIQEVPLERHRS
jgi:ABC-type nitrate/sulfonate/bicarbonate transport system permease component